MLKFLKGWKTVLVAIALVLVSLADILQMIDLHALFSLFLPENRVGGVVAVVTLVFTVLRVFTVGAVGQKEPE